MRKDHPKNERIKRNYLAHLEEPATPLLEKADATALTQRIRTAVDGLWDMLLEAHDRQAWKALGYAGLEGYDAGKPAERFGRGQGTGHGRP